ncbi:MAG: hypothetical protein AAF842_02510 [Planctomycetota bacterium]
MTTLAATPAPVDRRLAQQADRQRHVRIALKAAVGGTLAFAFVNLFHVDAASFGPIMIFLLMGLFADNVLRAGIHGIVGIFVCGWAATFIAYVCLGQPATFIAAMLLLIGASTLLLDKAALFSIVGPIIASAMMIQYIFDGAEAAQNIRKDFFWMMVVGTIIATLVDRLMWPDGGKRGFLDRFALCFEDMADRVEVWRVAVHRGKTPPEAPDTAVVADLADLWDLAGREANHTRGKPEPKHDLAGHCRRLILRRALLRRCMRMGRYEEWRPELRESVVELVDIELACIRRISDAAARHAPAPTLDASSWRRLDEIADRLKQAPPGSRVAHLLMARVIVMLLRKLYEDCDEIATTYNQVRIGERAAGPGKAQPLFAWPTIGKPEVIRSVKVMIVLFVLLMGELVFDLPGSSQVAFFGVFFAITANVGLQNEHTLLAVAGIVSAVAYTIVSIVILSYVPHQTLALGLLFLAFFVYMYIVHASTRFSFGALHAGLGFCFAYPTFPGPVWSLDTIETRFEALLFAGVVAMVFHGLVWPSRPLDQVRAAIVKTLADTADRLDEIRRDAIDGHSSPRGPEDQLAQVAPQLAALLHHAHFASIQRGAERDAWYAMVLELQTIVGAVTILRHEMARLDHGPATERMLRELDDAWRESVRCLHGMAGCVACEPGDATPPQPDPQPIASFRQSLIDSTPDPAEDLDRARMIFVAQCLQEIATATRTLGQRYASMARKPADRRRPIAAVAPAP